MAKPAPSRTDGSTSSAARRTADRVSFAEAALAAALAALTIVYALQAHSPLRLDHDATILLTLSARLTDHQSFELHGERPLYPIGVPLIFSLMERAHLAGPLGFALFNLTCVAIGAGCTFLLAKRFGFPPALCLLAVLVPFSNFTYFKHCVIPLTDLPYLAISLPTLLAMENAARGDRRRWAWLLLSAVLVIVAILIRRMALSLVPVLLWTAFPSASERAGLRRWLQGAPVRRMAVAVIAAAGLVLGVLALRHVFYTPELVSKLGTTSPADVATELIYSRIQDFGELALNVSSSMLGRFSGLTLPAGIALAALVLLALWNDRRRLRPAIVYLLSYLAVMMAWPFGGDARLWMPVLPVLILVLIQWISPHWGVAAVRYLAVGWLAVYFFLAMLAAAYATRISFSGARFPDLYGGGSERAFYAAAARPPRPDDDDNVRVIRRYGQLR